MNNQINVEKTQEVYGYHPNELKPSSHRPVFWNCESCNTEKIKKFAYAKKNTLCLLCSNKKNANTNVEQRNEKLRDWYKNNDHVLKGTKRPEHVRQALIASSTGRIKSDEERAYRSILMTGENNPFHGKTHSEESLIKMRAASRRNVRTGKDSNLYGKMYHGKRKLYQLGDTEIYFRSSWELAVAEHLDAHGIEWLYEPTKFEISYTYDGVDKQGTYRPDFYLPAEQLYIEVKGYWRDDASVKVEAFKEKYASLRLDIWDKAVLLDKGIKIRLYGKQK